VTVSFTIARETYPLLQFSFAGLPETMAGGDIEPGDYVTFDLVVQEKMSDDLREALVNPQGFTANFDHKEYRFSVREARLVAPLPERDYGRRHLAITFKARRDCIVMVRPAGRPAPNPDTGWYDALFAFSQQKDHLRRKRLELAEFEAEVAKRRAMLEEAEEFLAARRATLWSGASPEMRAGAEARGL